MASKIQKKDNLKKYLSCHRMAIVASNPKDPLSEHINQMDVKNKHAVGGNACT